VKRFFACRLAFFEITAFAASRIVWVERKFCSNRITEASGKRCSNCKMLRTSAARKR